MVYFPKIEEVERRQEKAETAIESLKTMQNDILYRRLNSYPSLIPGITNWEARAQDEKRKAKIKPCPPSIPTLNQVNDRLNVVVQNIRTRSKPALERIKRQIEEEKFDSLTLGQYLMLMRQRSGKTITSIREITGVHVGSLWSMERRSQLLTNKHINIYKAAGVNVSDKVIDRLRRKSLPENPTLGQVLAFERKVRDITRQQIADIAGASEDNFSLMERGVRPVSKRMRDIYERVLGIKIPKSLITEQEKKTKERWRNTFYTRSLSRFQANNTQTKEETLGDYLRRKRLDAKRPLDSLAHIIGHTDRSLGLVEVGKTAATDKVLSLYQKELGIEIPQHLLDQNTARRKDTQRRRIETVKTKGKSKAKHSLQ